MGCISSTRVTILANKSIPQSMEERHAAAKPHGKGTSIQDDARSFRSKVGALKMLIRAATAFESILKYLNQHGRGEYLICYRDMEEIKCLDNDQMVSRTAALIWRYKTSYEAVRASGQVADTIEYRIWECFGKLRQLDIANAPADVVKKYLIIAQNEIMARLVVPFDDYLLSPNYKEWQESQIEAEKQRRQASRQVSRDNSMVFSHGNSTSTSNLDSANSRGNTIALNLRINSQSPKASMHGNVTVSPHSAQPSLLSEDFAICAADYPDVLIVDDSLVTLKITGLTLERDGHNVERAANGHIALQLMKSRPYDVVLIDCNMPVMDGFEAVRLFREHERSINDPALFHFRRRPGARRHDPNAILEEDEAGDDLSDISDSDDEIYGEDSTLPRPLPPEPTHYHPHSRVLTLPHSDAISPTAANKNTIPLFEAGQPIQGERQMRRSLTNEHYHQLIIGMSTSIDDETRERALKAGMDFFLPKPFTLQKFIETLRQSRELKNNLWQQSKAGLVVCTGNNTANNSCNNNATANKCQSISSYGNNDTSTVVDSMGGISPSHHSHPSESNKTPSTLQHKTASEPKEQRAEIRETSSQ
jgi:CheY-like chemotaxis protein